VEALDESILGVAEVEIARVQEVHAILKALQVKNGFESEPDTF
jgi:hypothetical protein